MDEIEIRAWKLHEIHQVVELAQKARKAFTLATAIEQQAKAYKGDGRVRNVHRVHREIEALCQATRDAQDEMYRLAARVVRLADYHAFRFYRIYHISARSNRV